MTQIYSFYRVSDGTFTGDTYAGQDPASAAPEGCLAMPGRFNPSAQRVEVKTGEIVDWRAPAPDSDTFTSWTWDESLGRWIAGMTTDGLARAVRTERDSRLSACDWVVIRATEMATPVPAAWAVYRAALRAVPQQSGFPNVVEWPSPPA